MILVSACLLGKNVKYSGGNNHFPLLTEHFDPAVFLPVCPECLGELPIPRPPAEIEGGFRGEDVWSGTARVLNKEGGDVTPAFRLGAERALSLAMAADSPVTAAILKERSPSCGSHLIYDGTFSGNKIPGSGVTAALLKKHGIPVYSEEDLTEELLLRLISEDRKKNA